MGNLKLRMRKFMNLLRGSVFLILALTVIVSCHSSSAGDDISTIYANIKIGNTKDEVIHQFSQPVKIETSSSIIGIKIFSLTWQDNINIVTVSFMEDRVVYKSIKTLNQNEGGPLWKKYFKM